MNSILSVLLWKDALSIYGSGGRVVDGIISSSVEVENELGIRFLHSNSLCKVRHVRLSVGVAQNR